MQFLNSLLVTSSFILFSILHWQVYCYQAQGDVPQFGPNIIIYFGYLPNFNPCGTSDDAKPLQKTVLKNYKISKKNGLDTLLPKNGVDVEAMLYVISKSILEETIGPNVMEATGGKEVYQLKTFSVEIDLNGKKETIPCHAFVIN